MSETKEPSEALQKAREKLAKDMGVWLVIFKLPDGSISTFKTPSRTEFIETIETKIIPTCKVLEIFRGAKVVSMKTRVAVDLMV